MNLTLVGLGIALGTAVVVTILVRFFNKPDPITCPQCDSQNVVQTGKEPIKVGFHERMNGGFGGGAPEVVTTFRVSYRCSNCQHRWHKTYKDWNQ